MEGRKMDTSRHFDIEELGDVISIRLMDPMFFDIDDYTSLQGELVEFVEREHPRKLVVDFSRVEYCSTAIMAALLMVKDRVESESGRLKTCEMSHTVCESFERLKLDQTAFELHKTKAAALDTF